MKKFILHIQCLCLIFIGLASLYAQSGDAGREDLFYKGMGARILGMGGAAVAYADDPSVFYWNPAGLSLTDQQKAGFSLTTLFEGSQYNNFCYVFPTLSTGYFGIGVARIGTNDIQVTDWNGNVFIEQPDTWSYWWGKLSLAYAVPVYRGLVMGLTFHANRQVLGTHSTNGFGFDFGLLYPIPAQSGLFHDFYLGISSNNLIQPRMKLGPTSETIPTIHRMGLAKIVQLRENKDQLLLLTDLEMHQDRNSMMHIGFEYRYQSMAFLRLGFDNGQFAMGAGLKYNRFQIDYASGQLGDPGYFSRSNRITVQVFLGSSLTEQASRIEKEKLQEINRRTSQQMQAESQRIIRESLTSGKNYLEAKDYFNARLEFSRVLREDESHQEAIELLTKTTEEEQALQKAREQELLNQEIEKEKVQQDNAFINQKFSQGLDALESGDFQKAIDEWREALEKDPDHPQLNQYITNAEQALRQEVNRMIANAKASIRNDNNSQAIQILARAKELSKGDAQLHQRVLQEIANIDRLLKFYDNYQSGIKRYSNGEYKAAAQYFEQALQYAPQKERTRIQELYRGALARSEGTKTKPTGNAREAYIRGVNLYKQGKFEEALKALEEAAELDPTNARIARDIENVKRRLNTINKNSD